MAWSVRTEGGEKLRELQLRIKHAGDSGMNRKFRKNIRDAGRPAVTDIKAAVMRVKVTPSQPVKKPRTGRHRGRRSSGLRARVARATGISQTRKGIRIRVSARKMGPYGLTLPRYLDADIPGRGRWRRWRYPVFWPGPIGTAHEKRVRQQTGSPYFFVTVQRHRASFRRAAFKVMDETGRELTR